MAVSKAVEQVEDSDESLEEFIERKVDEKVEQRVAEETADLRRENQQLREYNRRLTRAVGEFERAVWTKIQKDMPSNSTFRYAFAKLAEELSGEDVEDYSAEPHEHTSKFAIVRDDLNELTRTVDEHSGALDSIGHGKPEGKDDAWQRIVTAAQNLEGNSGENTVDVDGRYDVVLYWNNIKTATGYSPRYCKQLISEFGDEDYDHKKAGARCEDYEPPSPQNDNNARRKRLYIDLDVWGND